MLVATWLLARIDGVLAERAVRIKASSDAARRVRGDFGCGRVRRLDRAQSLEAEGLGSRGRTVGFALTVLQRRLASSPEAILRSLQRRRERLHKQLDAPAGRPAPVPLADLDLLDDDEVPGVEHEQLEDEVVDLATAARSREELAAEIAELDALIGIALAVRRQDTDRKWQELREILERDAVALSGGRLRKLIVFTEHRDTLRYLVERPLWRGKVETCVEVREPTNRRGRVCQLVVIKTLRFARGPDARTPLPVGPP
ncbi:MAG: hypothetical protein M3P96_12920 [Actinomycetota bacterium]|nr:hypothetical protein [Actinomycetota bacterium]